MIDWVNDINQIGLQWYATFTRKPAASTAGQTVGNQTTTPTPTGVAVVANSYTGVLVVGGVIAIVLLVIYLLLR